MPNINASLILNAIEGDEAVDITPVGSSVVDEPVAPEVTPSDQPAVINDADRNALFLMCMQTANPQGFQSFVKEHAIDMEVQGLVPSAEGLSAAVDSMKGGTHQVVHMAAALLAKNGDSSLYDAYTAAVNAEEAAVSAIMQAYGDAATTLVQDVISEYIAKSNSMQTNAGDGIRSMLDQARTSLPVNMVMESDLRFIDTELEFCMETERMCEAFESELNDNFYEYAAYALEADEGKPGIGQKIRGVAQGAWAKIKALFRRIQMAVLHFIDFLKSKGKRTIARLSSYNRTAIPMTATRQKMFKEIGKSINLAMAFIRKANDGQRILAKAANLVKNQNANDADVASVTSDITRIKGEMDKFREQLNSIADIINDLEEKGREDKKVIGNFKAGLGNVEMLDNESMKAADAYKQLNGTFDNATSTSANTDDGVPAKQKLCFAAAALMNSFTIGNNKIFSILSHANADFPDYDDEDSPASDSKTK